MGAYSYVYILQSVNFPERFYVGHTRDLRSRIARHNAGRIRHTAKWMPWVIKTYVALSNPQRAVELERYLKSASGRAFTKKRF
jgi:predicted GIY-YIG superfamily endonuclease